mmetsp:Transcript_1650/g.2159  ORF Transcript_1650/g.2159 Transcript_1650/m.2159 type:complete len:112 (-) Transcript_1650:23-358(-)
MPFHVFPFPVISTQDDIVDVSISLFGIVRDSNDSIALDRDYSPNCLLHGAEATLLPDGRFGFPSLVIQIPDELEHDEFCFVFSLYDQHGAFVGCKRSEATFSLCVPAGMQE